MSKSTIAVGAGPTAQTIELRRVTKADEATIAKITNHNRQLEAYLCFGADLSLSALGELRVADVAVLVAALAAVEGRDLVEALPEADDLIWMTADADDRAPIYRALERIYAVFATDGPRAEPPEAPAAEPAAPAEPELPVDYRATLAEISVPLQFPFKIGEQDIAVIRLLPPTFGDGAAAARGEISEVEKVARMASLPVQAMRALRWPDAEKIFAIAQTMTPDDGR